MNDIKSREDLELLLQLFYNHALKESSLPKSQK